MNLSTELMALCARAEARREGAIDVEAVRALLATPQPAPIDMVLHCPACGKQHIDAPMTDAQYTERLHESSWWECGGDKPERWINPPHRSHLCHGCGHIWRPADVPTNGVAAVRTAGKKDSPIVTTRPAQEPVAEVSPYHLRPRPGGGHWCREVLLYSGNSPHDLGSNSQRVKLYAAPQPVQEPVAWRLKHEAGHWCVITAEELRRQQDWVKKMWQAAEPLYAAQPRSAPLTDEQIFRCRDEATDEYAADPAEDNYHALFARAIERAHGIGGEA